MFSLFISSQASTHEAAADRLNMELSQAQGKLDECMEQLALKSKDLANTKSDVVSLQQQQTQMEQQVIIDVLTRLFPKRNTLIRGTLFTKS